MHGFNPSKGIIVVAATNFPDVSPSITAQSLNQRVCVRCARGASAERQLVCEYIVRLVYRKTLNQLLAMDGLNCHQLPRLQHASYNRHF